MSSSDSTPTPITNSGRFHVFHGIVVRRTVNTWKVQTTGDDAPYGEAPGRVFTIPALGDRKHSANNCVTLDA